MSTDPQYRVNPTGANMREEPSSKARAVTLLTPGTIVHLDHIDANWYYVTFGGWVYKSTVTALEPTEAIK